MKIWDRLKQGVEWVVIKIIIITAKVNIIPNNFSVSKRFIL